MPAPGPTPAPSPAVPPLQPAAHDVPQGIEPVAPQPQDYGSVPPLTPGSGDGGSNVPPFTPGSAANDSSPQFNGGFQGAPVYAKGCVAQAFDDIMNLPGAKQHVMRICIIIGAISIIPVVGWVATVILSIFAMGFALEWGRDLSRGRGFDMGGKLCRSSLFSLGFFASALEVGLQLIAWIPVIIVFLVALVATGGLAMLAGSAASSGMSGYVSDGYGYYGGYGDGATEAFRSSLGALGAFLGGLIGLILILTIICVVLSVIMAMVSDAAGMHMAVTGRVESAFNIKEIWSKVKAQMGKLFCCTIVPGLAVGIVGGIVSTLINFIFSLLGGIFMVSGVTWLGGGIMLLGTACSTFVVGACTVFATILRYRAVGHWAARYAPEWANEADAADAPQLPQGASGQQA